MFFQRILAHPGVPLDAFEVQRLMGAGADPNARNEHGCMPLHVAFAVRMDEGSLRALAAVTDMAAVSSVVLTRCAVDTGRLGLLVALGGTIVRGADGAGADGAEGGDWRRPIEHLAVSAAEAGRAVEPLDTTLRLLLAPFGRAESVARANVRDRRGRTLLQRALVSEAVPEEVVALLLNARADPFARNPTDNRTPISIAMAAHARERDVARRLAMVRRFRRVAALIREALGQ